MNRKTVALCTAGLILVATFAESAETRGQFSFSPVAGGYTYEGTQKLKTGPVYGGRLGYNLTRDFGIEALFDYSRTKETKNSEQATLYRFGTDLLCYLLPDSRLTPYLAVGISGIKIDGSARDKDLRAGLDYGAGIKYFLTDSFALRGDVRHVIYNHSSTTFNNLEYTLGGFIPFGGTKPSTAPIEAVAASVQEPPPAVKPVETVQLPSQTSRIVVPVMQQPDSDGDGIIDTLDICPDTPPGAAVDAKGCTVTTGTSRKAEAAMRFCDKLTSLAITFDSGRDDVKAAYHEELARVGIFLKEYPNAKGTIAGHTDNSGPLALNMALSQKRAENVRDFIVTTFGIDRSRLTAVGFGPTKPVASNTTSAGKTKNRRIEAVFSCK